MSSVDCVYLLDAGHAAFCVSSSLKSESSVFSSDISVFSTILSLSPAEGNCFYLCQVVFLCGEPADIWQRLTPCSPLNFCIAANTFNLMPAAAAAHWGIRWKVPKNDHNRAWHNFIFQLLNISYLWCDIRHIPEWKLDDLQHKNNFHITCSTYFAAYLFVPLIFLLTFHYMNHFLSCPQCKGVVIVISCG